jgi:hypothetical protein
VDTAHRSGGKWLLMALALVVAGVGLWLSALAGAEDQPTVRQGGYGDATCDAQTQAIDTEITKAPKKHTAKRRKAEEGQAQVRGRGRLRQRRWRGRPHTRRPQVEDRRLS